MENNIKFPYKINFDYEYQLFDPYYSSQLKQYLKIRKRLEYAFFLLYDESDKEVILEAQYSDQYLKKLKQLGFNLDFKIFPKNKISNDVQYWWGEFRNIEFEKKMNSKIFSFELAKKFRWGIDQCYLVQSLNFLEKVLKNFPQKSWLLRPQYSFSGSFFLRFKTNEFFDDSNQNLRKTINDLFLKKQSFILSPYLNRSLDLGTLYYKKKILRHINFIDEKCRFKASLVFQDECLLKDFIARISQHNLSFWNAYLKFVTDGEQIIHYLTNQFELNDFGFDSFIFKNFSQNDLSLDSFDYETYSLVEINYRKSLGLVTHRLKELFKDEKIIFWMISDQRPQQEQIIDLSPENSKFKILKFKFDNLDQLILKLQQEFPHYF